MLGKIFKSLRTIRARNAIWLKKYVNPYESQQLELFKYIRRFPDFNRRNQYDIFKSSVRKRHNCIDNVFICVNFAKKDFGGVLSTG